MSLNLIPFQVSKRDYCISTKFDIIEIDQIGNYYFVQNDQLKKYNNQGELIRIYSNKKLGRINSIDVSNPLKILLFYKDQSQLIYLDSQLTQTSESIELLSYELEQSDLACTSINNGIWLFNRQNSELVRLNSNFEKVVKTGNLNVLFSNNVKPNFLIEKENFVFLNIPDEGIMIFDFYGTYYKTIPIKDLIHFTINSGKIYYYKSDKLYKYDFLKFIEDDLVIKEQNLKEVIKINLGLIKVYNDSVCFVSSDF